MLSPVGVQTQELERDLQLQKEMQLALDPRHGQAESAALTKEISRLQLRQLELKTIQQRLQTEISNAIAKRETYVIKVCSWDAQPLAVYFCIWHLTQKGHCLHQTLRKTLHYILQNWACEPRRVCQDKW